MKEDYYNNKKLAVNIVLLLVGIALLILAYTGKLDSELWVSYGVVLTVIETLQIARNLRYRKDSKYKRKIDIEASDERNSYIRMKAWSWTGYLFVLGAAVISLICFITGRTETGKIISYCVCAEMVIFYVSYLILGRKY